MTAMHPARTRDRPGSSVILKPGAIVFIPAGTVYITMESTAAYRTCSRPSCGTLQKQPALTRPRRSPQRYLWTDAFAVCNYLGLFRTDRQHGLPRTGPAADRPGAPCPGQVPDDDSRTGWISGLSPEEGEEHPVAGGLRIGKSLPERRPGEPYDEQPEWDRDGQYYHYLTQWMHALCRAGRVTGDPVYTRLGGRACPDRSCRVHVRDPGGRMTHVLEDEHRPLPAAGPFDGAARPARRAGNLCRAAPCGRGDRHGTRPRAGDGRYDPDRPRSCPLQRKILSGSAGFWPMRAGYDRRLRNAGSCWILPCPGRIAASALDGLGMFTRTRALAMPGPVPPRLPRTRACDRPSRRRTDAGGA